MKGFCLEVTGSFACFTRPELKTERVSYDVPTPSSVRAVYDAILWKPAIFWKVKRIEVLAPIRWISVRRNEVGKVMSSRSNGICIEEDRQQRAGLFLRDVRYRFFAEFGFVPPEKRPIVVNPLPAWFDDASEVEVTGVPNHRPDEKEAKYAAMFERRARKGQSFTPPYLGCREFAADVRLVPDPACDPVTVPEELKGERDLGWMLFDMDYSDPKNVKPLFYRALMRDGSIDVPDRENREEVRG